MMNAKKNDSLIKKLREHGLSPNKATRLDSLIKSCLKDNNSEECWRCLVSDRSFCKYPFLIQKLIYEYVYPDWKKKPAPVWFPDDTTINNTHIAKLMHEKKFKTYQELHNWSTSDHEDFWQTMITKLNIKFDKAYTEIVNTQSGLESPVWFPGAKLNIVNSCFNANENDIAIIEHNEEEKVVKITYKELNLLSNRIAHSLNKYLVKGDKLSIIMPMSIFAVAIYLGALKAGYCVVPIPESFAADEIAKRLYTTNVKLVFSQFDIIRDKTRLPLYKKLIDANSPVIIVLDNHVKKNKLRNQDILWKKFLGQDDSNVTLSCEPNSFINIIYSSGTTSTPKLIPWDHTTPIKCASDAYLHLNIQAHDIVCWPTNLGWMMGPWLIFASLINQATIALYNGTPTKINFGKFVKDEHVTFLGVSPSLVKAWRDSACMEGMNWASIKAFCSTGECSNIDDMLYLMSLTHYKIPIIEYCGGTEIGGAYLTSTLLHSNAPAAFTTPALGIDFQIIDEDGLVTNKDEAFIVPPSIGLSTELLNSNHHDIYYSNLPGTLQKKILRRHGDIVERYPNGFFRVHGRIDETMNLNGIKISSIEIENVINQLAYIQESASVSIASDNAGGPGKLVLFIVLKNDAKVEHDHLKIELQSFINDHLNPLFKIHDVIIVDFLPKTASNKLMRSVLKDQYPFIKIKSKSKKNKIRKKVCLALQGGGAYGAYSWGILDKLLEDDRIEIDSISSTSAGSVNAAIMVQGMINGGNNGARHLLNDFWLTLSQYSSYLSPIRSVLPFAGFHLKNDMSAQLSFLLFDLTTRIFSPYILNPFNFDILRLILNNKIDFSQLRKYHKIQLFISATNVKTGLLRVFENSDLTVEAILASTCLPHLNQAVEINKEYYWDGGFLGNPSIYPLIYNSKVDDIIIIHNNPIARETLPLTSTEIDNRMNEISFNSSLLRELRVIAFISKLIDKGCITPEYKDSIRRKYVHIIRSDEVMNQFSLINKFNLHWEFLCHLRDIGRSTAESWLNTNFDYLGKKETIDFRVFLGTDIQAGK